MDHLLSFAAMAATVLAVGVGWRLLGRGAAGPGASEHAHFRTQILRTALVGVGVIVVVLELPISDAVQGQLLGLIGLLLSAMIALSSTTFVANAMAGIMLRSVGNFRAGDFVRVGEQFGRISDRGLFHTEIQTEDRDLTTLPNLYLVTNPVTVVRADGTIVSATVSLGYDMHHSRVRTVLLQAAEQAGLSDGFVRTVELLDHAVVYRVAGFLAEAKTLLGVRSRLREAMLDALHGAGMEIASPSIMIQRRGDEQRLIARSPRLVPSEPGPEVEGLMFDKAEQAERLDGLRALRGKAVEELAALADDQPQAAERRAMLERRIEWLDGLIEARIKAGED